MMVQRSGLSNGIKWSARTALVGVFLAVVTAPAWGQSKFIRTPAEATNAQRDWVPPWLYGFGLMETNPTYYGGIDSRLDYGYGRGWGYANMIGFRPPNSYFSFLGHPAPPGGWLPDKLPWFTSYPDTGDIYVRYNPKAGPPPGPGPQVGEPVARFLIRVPAEATVWIEDKPTSLTGPERQFVSPPLLPGKTYLYDIRARWQENGRDVEQKQTISLQVGSDVKVRFPAPEPLKFPKGVAEEDTMP